MPDEEIRKILSELEYNNGYFPETAVTAAIAQKDEIIPHLLNIIRNTIRNAKVLVEKDNYFAHLYAMYLLAQFREKRAYPLIVEFSRLPGKLTEDLLGDTITEDMGRILASVCGGDTGLIKKLIEDENANEWARGAGINCIAILVFNGLLSRDRAVEYFHHLFHGGLERKFSHVWNELAARAADLYPGELMDEIRKAYEDGLVEDGFITLDNIEDDLGRGRAAVMAEHKEMDRGLICDVVDDMSWWHCFEADDEEEDLSGEDHPVEPYARAEPKVGRNDPCPCGSGRKYKKCCLRE